MLATRVKVERSADEKGWAVEANGARWRFERREFAEQFAERFLDEHFAVSIIAHAHEHDWGRCEPMECKGALWQIIQGME